MSHIHFYEVTESSQIQGKRGHLWAVGIDSDPQPYGDGKAKILFHIATQSDEGFCAVVIEDKLSRGCRVFLAESSEWLCDRYGFPTNELHAKVITEAVESFKAKGETT